jgi:hypothetical protein
MDIIVPNGNEMHSVMYGWVYWSAWYQDIPLYARVVESILLLTKSNCHRKNDIKRYDTRTIALPSYSHIEVKEIYY